MIRMQWKLLFRSALRIFLIAAYFGISFWCGGSMIYNNMRTSGFAELGSIYRHAGSFIYIFILLLFLSYDYFREIPDAGLLEPVKVTGKDWKHDWNQFLVLFCMVLVNGALFLMIHTGGSLYGCFFTVQYFVYLLKVAGVFLILNGIIAILLGWLVSRSVGKILGYIILVLFAVMVSPMLTEKLKFYVLWARGIFDWFRMFLIMPQGIETSYYHTLYPVNLTVVSRSLFWVGLFMTGLALCYRSREKQWLRWGVGSIGLFCSVWCLIYSGLPASYYCNSETLGADDSGLYDQWHYIIDGTEQSEKGDSAFQASAYEIRMKLRRQMQAEVILYPAQKELSSYDMTLYHLYEVEEVTDTEGTVLNYERQGDYLRVYRDTEPLEGIRICYRGGCANFYSNQNEVNLPGWFAYYPIPGIHEIYHVEEHRYANNTLEQPAEFYVEIDAGGTIYSDLEQVERNCFQGNSTGPSLLAGFVKEVELPGGITYVYPYLDDVSIPDLVHHSHGFGSQAGIPGSDSYELKTIYEDIQSSYEYVLERLQQEDCKIQTIMCMPPLASQDAYIYEEERIVDSVTWKSLRMVYEESGGFSRTDQYEEAEEKTEEEVTAAVLSLYGEFRKSMSGQELYDISIDMYLQHMSEFGYTEEDFQGFIREQFGEEEWNRMMEQ